MRILHYSLGLPPARSGGLTRYATDLMTAQCGRHQVSLLYPGRWQPFGGRVRVRRGKDYGDVAVYELINPLPVPLSYGVREPGGFLQAKKLDRTSLEAFYEQVRPDILHLHTWMGLPAGVLDFLKEKGVRCSLPPTIIMESVLVSAWSMRPALPVRDRKRDDVRLAMRRLRHPPGFACGAAGWLCG